MADDALTRKEAEMNDKDKLGEFVMDMLGIGYLLIRFVAFLLPLVFLLLIGFLFGRIT